MKIRKIETNYKRNLYFYETKNIKLKKYSNKIENNVINIYPNIVYQNIIGFGGAFTESTAFCLNSVNNTISEKIIKEYFSDTGLNYNFCRLPIGSSDFSLDSYSYSTKKDLSDFSIARDQKYIIPAIKSAQKINNNIKFLASPWSPPKFMKNTKMLYLGGKLQDKYKQTWTNYLIKYIKEYEKENIKIDYMTIQNEPNAIQIWESCLYSPEEEIDLLQNYLYPNFKKNNLNVKFLIWDHNKEKLLDRAIKEIKNNSALNSISGFAFHWYSGDHFENIQLVHELFPGKLLIHTEGCTGYSHFNPNDEIHNAEIYGHDIIGDLNAGINGFIDWNMVLDNNGGPNHKKNYCNSPIMLSKNNDNYIKNLTFYYIGHFSKYIKPNSKRIAFSKFTDYIEVSSFKNPNNSIVVIMMNKNDTNKEYNLCINDSFIHDNLDSHTIITYIFEE